MSFSPTAFILSALITGSALGGLMTAPDRHYRVKNDYSLGSLFWIDEQESSSLLTIFTNTESDVCLRPRLYEVDIRRSDEYTAEHSDRQQTLSSSSSDSQFILATTIAIPPSPLQYHRNWPAHCAIPAGERMIDVWAIDGKMPFDAIPVTNGANNEVSACLKIDDEGRVVKFRYAQPAMKISNKIAAKIELAARKCWKFENQTGVEGWIQAGLDQRAESNGI